MTEIMKMLDALDRDEPLVIYDDGSQAYDFVSVLDCARTCSPWPPMRPTPLQRWEGSPHHATRDR